MTAIATPTQSPAAPPPGRLPSRTKVRRTTLISRYVVLTACAIITIYPLLWMVASSFKHEGEIFTSASLIPSEFDLSNYVEGWNALNVSFGKFFLTTMIICAIAVVGNIISCSMAGYAFGALEFPGRKWMFAVMLGTLMLPVHATIVPQYILFKSLNMTGTILPLVLPKFVAVDAFFVFLIVQFVRGLPRELFEAARVDGAGPIRIYLRIVLPLVSPALVTVSIFTFIWTWNDFFSQLIYLTDPQMYTVSLGLRLFIDSTGLSSYGPMFAMATLALIPTTLIFLFFQRRLVEGVATTGLKG